MSSRENIGGGGDILEEDLIFENLMAVKHMLLDVMETQDHANISGKFWFYFRFRPPVWQFDLMVRRAILRSADKVSKMQALDNEQLRIENLRLREENEELISENRRLNTKLDQMRVFFQEALRNAPDSIN